jgi:hypothetical protein
MTPTWGTGCHAQGCNRDTDRARQLFCHRHANKCNSVISDWLNHLNKQGLDREGGPTPRYMVAYYAMVVDLAISDFKSERVVLDLWNTLLTHGAKLEKTPDYGRLGEVTGIHRWCFKHQRVMALDGYLEKVE